MGTEIDSLNFVTEWQDGPSQAWRTVTGVMDRNKLFKGIESLNFVTEQHDGPSQARRAVTGCVIPGWVGFL